MNNIKANLAGTLRVGQCINYEGAVYRIAAKGQELSAFPGGIGVYEMDLEYIQPYPIGGPMTKLGLDTLEAKLNGAEDTDWLRHGLNKG